MSDMIVYKGKSTGVYNDGSTALQLKRQIHRAIHVPIESQSIIHEGVVLDDSESSSIASSLSLVVSHLQFMARMANSHPHASRAQCGALQSVVKWASSDPECARSALLSCYAWYIPPYTIKFLRMGLRYHHATPEATQLSFKMTINEAIEECQKTGCNGFSVELPSNMESQIVQQYNGPEYKMVIALYTMHENLCNEPVHVTFDGRDKGVNETLLVRGFEHLTSNEAGETEKSSMLVYIIQHDAAFGTKRVRYCNLVSAAIQITSEEPGWKGRHFDSQSIQTLMSLCQSAVADTIANEFGISALRRYATQPYRARALITDCFACAGIIFRLSKLRSRNDAEFLATLKDLLGESGSALLNAVSFALRKFAPIKDVAVLQALRQCAEKTANASILKTLKVVSHPSMSTWSEILKKIQSKNVDRRIICQLSKYANQPIV